MPAEPAFCICLVYSCQSHNTHNLKFNIEDTLWAFTSAERIIGARIIIELKLEENNVARISYLSVTTYNSHSQGKQRTIYKYIR
jgi:hypothetical protein